MVALVAAMLTSVLPVPVSAFPRPHVISCPGNTIKYRFEGANWTDATKAQVRAGFQQWNAIRDWNGNQMVSVTEVTTGHNVRVYRVDDLGYYGYTTCYPLGTEKIELDSELSGNDLLAVARHEMGHMLALNHTGKSDAQYGGTTNPAMGTCLPAGAWNNQAVVQDDYGNAWHKRSTLSPRAVHANASFEQGTSFWGKSANMNWSTTSTSASDGSTSLLVTPTGANAYIFQTMNYATSQNTSIDGRANIRELQASHTGLMTVTLTRQGVSYPAASGCVAGEFPSGRNQNLRDAPDPWTTVRTQACTPTTSWATCSTTTYTLPTKHAHDLRVYVYSAVKTAGGAWTAAGIDFVRIRDRG